MSMVAGEEALQGGGGSSVPAWTPGTSPRMTTGLVGRSLVYAATQALLKKLVILGLDPRIHASASQHCNSLDCSPHPAPIFRSSLP